jgi:hypothetical protein
MPNLVQFHSLTNIWQSFNINYRKITSRFANSTLILFGILESFATRPCKNLYSMVEFFIQNLCYSFYLPQINKVSQINQDVGMPNEYSFVRITEYQQKKNRIIFFIRLLQNKRIKNNSKKIAKYSNNFYSLFI